ncbi:MAG: hypothetical protein AAFZ63_24455 [Bacteroidota bacterium]
MKRNDLKLLVGEANLDKIFLKLREILSDEPALFNELMMISANYKTLRKSVTTSTADNKEVDRALNKVRTSLLNLIDHLSESQLSDRAKPEISNGNDELIGTKGTKNSEGLDAQSFFYTLDDNVSASFPNLIDGASSVKILARTGVNLLSQYHRNFLELGNSGCDIRLLIISPESDATKYVYGDNSEMFYGNAKKTDYYVKKLQDKLGTAFQVRSIKHAPTMGIMIIEKSQKENCFIVCQFYFSHSLIGRDRPLFRVNYGDKWYRPFFNEFNELWKSGDKWSLKSVDNEK